jgi:hypothetical protein
MKVVFVALDAGNIHLNLDDAGIDAIHRGAESLIKHAEVLESDAATITYPLGKSL